MSDASLAANVETVTGPGRATSGVQPGDRIAVLDVLRGVALLGMLIVHFNGRATLTGAGAGAGLDGAIDHAVDLFLTDRFYPMFGILFGVGFAVQLRRAEQRASRFTPMFLRRLLALAGFGFIAHGIFGFNVLIAYAIWGVPLLLVRNWSRGALMALLLACAASGPIRVIAIATYQSAVGTPRDQFKVGMEKEAAQNRAARAPLREAEKGTDFGRLVAERIRFLPHWYSRPFSYLPGGAFTLFLIGLLAFRSGLFDEPDRHRRLIVGAMAFGAASWAASSFLFPLPFTPSPSLPLPLDVARFLAVRSEFFSLLRAQWLAFTYVGAILLLVARDADWLRRLSFFGVTGRMALTNYMLQVILLDVAFSRYGLDLQIRKAYGPLFATALFVLDVIFSRWWLSRFRMGPLEWLWRSATYVRWQSLRREELAPPA